MTLLRNESIGIVNLQISQNKDRPEKKHKFEYKEKFNFETKEKFNTSDVKSVIRDELNFVTQLGSSKKDYNKFLSNLRILYIAERIKLQYEMEDKKKMMTREKEKIEENKRLVDGDKFLAKTALLHVNSLKNWEKNTLPKIGKS